MTNLKDVLEREKVSAANQESIQHYLMLLWKRDVSTYHHALRVGVLACDIAKYLDFPGVTSKSLLWAGLLHDTGKSLISPDLLQKTANFTEEDFQQVQPHVEYGWKILQRVHDYTAHIIVRHHRFGPNPYPAELPPLPDYLRPKESAINFSARILALADFYDALMTRDNGKFGAGIGKRELFLKFNEDMLPAILNMEDKGVLNFQKNPVDLEELH
jgi:HD-GYP domain-containing protein (c-di-GMP phosphodiesterase class II)